jgi:hypothetical protein
MSILAPDTVLARLMLPIGAIGLALLTEDQRWGLVNSFDLPTWAALPLGILLLDLAIYLQHMRCQPYGDCTACITQTLSSM